MGEELTRKSVGPAAENKGSSDTRGAGSGSGSPAGNSRPAAPGTGAAAARAGGTGAGGTEGKAQEKKPVGLDPVTAPAPEPPKKQTKKKKAPAKKKPEPSFNAEQISALILSASAIVSSRPGLEVFALRPEEANQLATPMANMIEKSEKLQAMGEHADALALVTASMVIFAPRFLVYSDQKKKKKLEANGGVQLVRKETKSAGSDRRTDGGHDTKRSTDVQSNPASTLGAIPAIL